MEYIPDEIIVDILCRLPAETFVRFKIVCKRWKSIIDDDPVLRLQPVDMLVIAPATNNNHHFAIPFCSLTSRTRTRTTIPAKKIHKRGLCTDRTVIFMDGESPSCHGFLLILHNHNFIYETPRCAWALWNPFSGECLDFRNDPGGYDPCFGNFGGVGYDVQTNDYKLVRYRKHPPHLTPAYFYSLKSGARSMVPDFPSGHCIKGFPLAVFANGALCWLAKDPTGAGEVILLDLSRETYSKHPWPSCIDSHDAFSRDNTRLHALDGCLFLSSSSRYIYPDHGMVWNIWILQQDCDKQNAKWNKLIVLRRIYNSADYHLKLVAYVKSKEQLVIRYEDRFMWFDLKNNKCMKTVTIDINVPASSFQCVVFPASLDWLTAGNRGDDPTIGKDDGLEVKIETSWCLDYGFSVQFH